MKLGYVILYVPNVSDTVAFYEKAFGLKRRFLHESQQYAEMETGATALAFAAEAFVAASLPFQVTRPEAKAPASEIALIAADVAKQFEQALQAGATPVLSPVVKPWGQTVSYVRDCNGFLVEICSALHS